MGGKPPFDPFLTASIIWETHLCPVAAIHDLLHGREVQPTGRYQHGRSQQLGDAWHSYIARLRLRIASGDLQLPTKVAHALAVIQQDFEEWAEPQLQYSDQRELWHQVELYVQSRLNTGHLQSIVGHQILPELSVGSNEIDVPLGSGKRTYPIEARLDEVDLSLGIVTERTTLPTNLALPNKMVQLAVSALILRSIPPPLIPPEWMGLRQIRQFLLETPTDTIPVNPTADDLTQAIHEAAAIIQDIAISELAEWPIWQLAQCTYQNPHDVCSHPYINCFYHTPIYPQARNSIKQETRRLCRAELYELLWRRDLKKYRLYSGHAAGPAYPAIPVQILRAAKDFQGQPFIEVRGQGDVSELGYAMLIIGTPHVGVRKQGRIIYDPTTGTARIYTDVFGLPLPNTGVLWPPTDEGVVLEQSPDFLIRLQQRNLFALRKIGRSDLQVAQQNPVLQLLDAIFSGTPALET